MMTNNRFNEEYKMSKMNSSGTTTLTANAHKRNLNVHKSDVVKAIAKGQRSLITVEGNINYKSQSKSKIHQLDFDGTAIGIAELYKY